MRNIPLPRNIERLVEQSLTAKHAVCAGITALGIIFVLMMTAKQLRSQTIPSIEISNPKANTTLTAGQTLLVTIQPNAGTLLQLASAWFVPLTAIPQRITTSPFIVQVSVPVDTTGLVTLIGTGIDQYGNRLKTSIQVRVVPGTAVQSIQVQPRSIQFRQLGSFRALSVLGTFADGSTVDVTNDSTFSVTNSLVVNIDASGVVHAIAPGVASAAVGYAGILTTTSITVDVFELQGDLNGDGAVDEIDLTILLGALNTSSTGPGDPRDLNGDGRIDAVDARILTNLCSRPRCASK